MRKNPQLQWAFDSLERQVRNKNIPVQFLLIDYWKEVREQDGFEKITPPDCFEFTHVEPLPSLVQGRHRITNHIWYAAANARNTAFVYCKYNNVAFIDDLSVIGDRWLDGVVDSIRGNYIALGAYRKVYNMKVENGVLIASEDRGDGQDSRWSMCGENQRIRVAGNNFFGCSSCMPLEAALKVNGFDLLTDTIRYEDTVMGVRLEKAGYKFFYDKRMLSIESNDHPQRDFEVRSIDEMLGEARYYEVMKELGIKNSRYPKDANKDCSHIIVDAAYARVQPFWNFFSLKDLREKHLRGETIELSDMNYKDYFWFSKKPLAEC